MGENCRENTWPLVLLLFPSSVFLSDFGPTCKGSIFGFGFVKLGPKNFMSLLFPSFSRCRFGHKSFKFAGKNIEKLGAEEILTNLTWNFHEWDAQLALGQEEACETHFAFLAAIGNRRTFLLFPFSSLPFSKVN